KKKKKKGVPETIYYAVFVFTQEEIPEQQNMMLNLFRFVTNKVLEHKHSNLSYKYYVPIALGKLESGQIREKIPDKEARAFWVKNFDHRPFGEWPLIADFLKKKYKEKVGSKHAKTRPLNIDSPNSFEYEFIMEELSYFAIEAG
ncbi:hypothetical protein RFI_33444, partial [Reticulomyxa filosa]